VSTRSTSRSSTSLVFTFLLAALGAFHVACSDDYSAPPKNDSNDRDDEEEATIPRRGDGGPVVTPASDGGSSGNGDAAPASQTSCVDRCVAKIAPKCDGDKEWCELICEDLTESALTCLEAAPSCDKTLWISCGATGGGGGTKPVDAGTTGGK
jgi:hypothetical protein